MSKICHASLTPQVAQLLAMSLIASLNYAPMSMAFAVNSLLEEAYVLLMWHNAPLQALVLVVVVYHVVSIVSASNTGEKTWHQGHVCGQMSHPKACHC